ncbi:MAG: DUF4843 domain-containing protein [Odoribacter sp.]|nr:DUF4843 domain-containing protein [Odoribacter sp.]
MKYIRFILFLCLSFILWTGCENDGFYYRDEPRIRLVGPEKWTVKTDSMEFSFLTYSSEIQSFQVDVVAWVMGPVADHDRTVNLEAGAGTTAGAHLYSFPTTFTVAAGENKVIVPVILKRAPELKNGQVRLNLRVLPSADFAVGNNEENHLLIKWNDIISQPKNWDEKLSEFFGDYSEEKYRFMLDYSSEPDGFAETELDWSALRNYNIIFTTKLYEYNQAHPENRLTFSFPDGF